MLPRRRGQLAIVSSVAGFRGLPGAIAYAASKAAVKSYGEGLRGRLAREGIEVNVICPGYIRSRMTARNKFPMPFLMDAERAARLIRRGLKQNRGRIAFPWPTYAAMRVFAALPEWLVDRLSRRIPEKG
jgi:short-subunit dehydrogenase